MPVPPPERIRLKIAYTIPWKGFTVTTSCSFYLTTATGAHSPASEAQWHALADDLVLRFKACLGTFAQIVSVTCYDVDSDMPVHSYTYATNGTHAAPVGAQRLPSTCAYLMKWTTTQRTSKNHPIYLFNYVHGLYEYLGDPDSCDNRGDIDTFGSRLAAAGAGLSDGATVYHKSGRYGAAAQLNVYTRYVTDHNLFT